MAEHLAFSFSHTASLGPSLSPACASPPLPPPYALPRTVTPFVESGRLSLLAPYLSRFAKKIGGVSQFFQKYSTLLARLYQCNPHVS